jgi:tetratricopeptide (TPR) repeat protein
MLLREVEMDLRILVIAGLLGLGGIADGQEPSPGPGTPSPAVRGQQPSTPESEATDDPFFLPPDAREFALKVTRTASGTQQKLQALLQAIFRPKDHGGLGMVYDNSHTRTVAQVWGDGKANCLSLTAFFVEACRVAGIRDEYAEALNTNHWRKVGSIVHYERHVVALTSVPPSGDMIADFVPDLHKRYGTYLVSIIPEARFKALYYSNRAAEALTDGDLEGAKTQAQRSLAADPKSSVGWNVLGVVRVALGETAAAEEAYLKAMEMDPKDGAPIGNMEALLRDAGRTGEAMTYRMKGEAVRKKDPYYHAYLAEEALAAMDLAEAATRIRSALKILPREPNFLLFSARLKLAEGDLEGALKGIQEAQRWADPSERERYDSKMAIIEGMKAEKVKP